MRAMQLIIFRVTLALVSSASVTLGCSWDYLIWMIRSKSADPLYRFVRSGKAGFIDETGKVVIKPAFEASSNGGHEFHDGLMEIGGSEGIYLDRTGKVILDTGFYRGWEFSEGLAVAMRKDGEKWGFIDRSGKFVITPRFESYHKGYPDSFSEGLAKIEVLAKVGYIDRSGEFVTPPRFLRGDRFSDGMARVVVEGPCMYVDGGNCSNIYPVPRNTPAENLPLCKYTFIDRSGTPLSDRYEAAEEFSEGLAAVRVGDLWGYIDKKGAMVIQPRFASAAPFSEGLARVQAHVEGLFGYIDRTGGYAIPPRFAYADDFSEDMAVAGDEPGGGVWYICKDGTKAFSEKFTLASHFYNGLAHVKLRGTSRLAYIDRNGQRVFSYSPQPLLLRLLAGLLHLRGLIPDEARGE